VHHGKRHRFSVIARGDSEAAAKEALEQLSQQVADFEPTMPRSSTRTAYRKWK
jgi:hypothetical protein